VLIAVLAGLAWLWCLVMPIAMTLVNAANDFACSDNPTGEGCSMRTGSRAAVVVDRAHPSRTSINSSWRAPGTPGRI